MKSTWAKPGSFEQKWYLYDAENVILGRLASKIEELLLVFYPSFQHKSVL